MEAGPVLPPAPTEDAMQTITLEEAQAHLAEIIDNSEATIRPTASPTPPEPPCFGTLKGTILSIAPDFDDIPEGFEEYLP
jgi:hypothetical protein